MGNKESNILLAVRTKHLQQLCKDQISSRYLSASRTSSGCFPTREVRFSAPVASLGTRGVVLQGVHPQALPSTHCTGPLQRLLWVVDLQEGGPVSLPRAVPGQAP